VSQKRYVYITPYHNKILEKMSGKVQVLKFDVFLDGDDGSVYMTSCNSISEVLDLLKDMHETFWSNDCYGNVTGWTIRVSLEKADK